MLRRNRIAIDRKLVTAGIGTIDDRELIANLATRVHDQFKVDKLDRSIGNCLSVVIESDKVFAVSGVDGQSLRLSKRQDTRERYPSPRLHQFDVIVTVAISNGKVSDA